MSKRATIYIPESSQEVLGGTDNLSGRYAAILSRYRAIVHDIMPEFLHGEWCAIFDANNGTDMIEQVSPTMVWANLADSSGMDDKWSIDAKSLVRRLQKLPPSVLLAIAEACVRFWQQADTPVDDALAVSWARVKAERAAT